MKNFIVKHKKHRSRSRSRSRAERTVDPSRQHRKHSTLVAEHSLLSERSTQYGNSRSPSVYSQNCETGIARIPSDSAFTDNNIARSPCGTALNDSKIQSEELIIHNDVELADEVLDILGEGPQEKDKHSFIIHSALASRWNHILTNGISETEFSSLITKYKLPNNCDMLSPPVLNPETKTIIPQNTMHT